LVDLFELKGRKIFDVAAFLKLALLLSPGKNEVIKFILLSRADRHNLCPRIAEALGRVYNM